MAVETLCHRCSLPMVPQQRIIASHFEDQGHFYAYIVRGVPVLECPQCGERIYDSAVAGRLRQLSEQVRKRVPTIPAGKDPGPSVLVTIYDFGALT
jgi:hypothetical protein